MSFINKRVEDPEMRVYQNMDCFPNSNDCPENVLNTWIPFAAELWDSHEERDQETIGTFKKPSTLILSNHQQDVVGRVVMPWIAHTIQYP